MNPEQEKQIRDIFQEMFDANYSNGSPRIPPHQHDGVDNLKISSANLSGNLVQSIIAGTGVTISPSSGTGNVTVNSSGGGGGSPGGNNTDIQFNDSSSFGGQDSFNFNKATNVVTLDDASQTGFDGGKITGGTSGIQLTTDDQASLSVSGYITIQAGDNTNSGGEGGSINVSAGDGPLDGFPGSVIVTAGKSGSISDAGLNDGGSITIAAGSTGEATGGNVTISTGSATTSGNGGRMRLTLGGTDSGNRSYLQVTQFDAFGSVQPNVAFSSGTPNFGGGQGVFYMRNRTTAPSSSPSSAGILYVEAGALMYMGSGGTVTTVAPA